MMISTKGRYALRVMIDLAENYGKGYAPMKEVAKRQEISLKYLERILPVLTKNKMIEGLQGKGGGYRLAVRPSDIRVGDILRRWHVLAVRQISVSVPRAAGHYRCGQSSTGLPMPILMELHWRI